MKQKIFKSKLFNTSAIQTVALVLLISVFASTCLLPVSEARAQAIPAGFVKNASGLLVPSSLKGAATTAAKGTGKSGLLSVLGSLGSAAITIGVIVALVDGLLLIARSFVSYMASPAPELYNLNSSFIQVGWKMMRDFCNLFFLLVLLFIAFCTILQIEKYNAKKNLLTLILMALLINFSKPIAIFIFDGSQLAMQFFLRQAGGGENIANILTISGNIGTILADTFRQASVWDMILTALFSIIFLFIFDVVLFCVGLFLLIRIVAVWLLVIVSPFAFFAMILPDFRKLASQWWDSLFRYSYVGPAIAFFLWLATRLKGFQVKQAGFLAQPSTSMQQLPMFIPFMITIIFLFAALMMANQFGIYFAQTITKSANRFMSWAAITALKWGERTALMKPITIGGRQFTLSPRAWIRGWQEHSAEVDRRALEQAMAHPRDVLSSIFKRGERPKTFFRDVQFSKLEAEKMKEIESISTESSYMWDVIQRAKKSKSREAQAAASAALKILFKNNDQDDYMIDGHHMAHDPLEAKKMMTKDLLETGMTEREIGKIFFQLGNIALPNGNMGYWGMGSYDKDTKDYKINDEGTHLAKMRAKAQTFETQGLAKVLHRNALMVEDAERGIDPLTGKETYKRVFTKVHRIGKIMAEILGQNEAALEQFKGRGKVDTLVASGAPENYRHWEEAARNAWQASKESKKAAEHFRQAGEMAKAQAETEKATILEKNTEIYLKFGETAHAAYTHGKDSKVIQITAPALKAFKAGADGEKWRKINEAEIARLVKEAEDAKKAGKSKSTAEPEEEDDELTGD